MLLGSFLTCVCLWIFQEELAARIPEQHAALLDKKDVEDSSAVKGPSRPEPEPPHIEVNQFCTLVETS